MSETYAQFMERLFTMPRAQAHEALYYAATGKKLNLSDPVNLNEKLQWLMVNRYDENVSLFADKLAVRDYVRACGYENILTKFYGAYETADEAYNDMAARLYGTGETANVTYADMAPRFNGANGTGDDADGSNATRFVLKCTHGSGPQFISICKDPKQFDLRAETEKLGRSLSCDYSRVGLEHHYHYIRPLIIAEEYLGDSPVDYKFFCFSGKAKYVKVIAGRGDGVHQDYYDMERKLCPFVKDEVSIHANEPERSLSEKLSDAGSALQNKEVFDQMAAIAGKLSEPFAVARVDLYYENGNIYFGEITLTPAAGLNRTDKPETLEYLGSLVDLDYEKPELYAFPRTDEAETLLSAGKKSRINPEANSSKSCLSRETEAPGSCINPEAVTLTGVNERESSPIPEAELKNIEAAAGRLLKTPGLLFTIDRNTANGLMSDCARIINSNMPKSLRESYMSILYRLAFRDDMSLEECWQIFWNLNRAMFLDYSLKPEGVSLDELYKYIAGFIESMLDYSFAECSENAGKEQNRSAVNTQTVSASCTGENASAKDGVIVLTTYQFLNVHHAPTQRLLDYAYAFQHDLKKHVVIINDAGMHFFENATLEGGYLFNFLDRLNDTDHIDYKDETFEYFQVPVRMPDLNILQQLVQMVYELRPELVMSVGGCSLLSDLCRSFAVTAAIPCSTQFPVTQAKYMLLPRRLEPEDAERVAALDGQKLVETNYNFVIRPGSVVYTLGQFDIPAGTKNAPDGCGKAANESATVATEAPARTNVMCVVGNRLDVEVDDSFLGILKEIYLGAAENEKEARYAYAENASLKEKSEYSAPYMLFIGLLNNKERVLNAIPERYHKYIRFTGPITDASELVRHAGIYLNPDRSGGGRSVFEACYYGVVPVSFRRGDGYFAAGPEFGVENGQEYINRVRTLLSSLDELEKGRKLALARSKTLSDMTATMRQILEVCCS